MSTQTPTPGHPFFDARPWEGPIPRAQLAEVIQAGDLVLAARGTTTRTAVAHHQDAKGQWLDASGNLLVTQVRAGQDWTVFRIPSPGPLPLPNAAPAEIVDVTTEESGTAAALVLARDGFWYGAFDQGDVTEDGVVLLMIDRVDADGILAFTDVDGQPWNRPDAETAWARGAAPEAA